MDSGSTTWWSRHGWTVALLLTAFAMAFAIRTIFSYPILQQFGNLYVYAGGSDSYYHSRVMQYIIANHRTLILDPLLHYPIGAINPREPLFDWMNASLGLAFAPFFGGNAVDAGAFFLNLQAPLWAALSVFPIYMIGREVGDRRTGLIAALIFPFLPATINESIFGYANYLSFYTFVILVVLYCYIRLVKVVGSRRWVESYRSPRSIARGFKAFLRNDRPAVKWAVFTGVGFGTLALAWQGYTYLIAIVGVFIIVAMVIERIRRVDSFGLYVSTLIVGLVGFPMAMPYYYFQHEFAGWFDLPLILFFGILALLLPFLLMRDWPWVVSIPSLVLIYLAGAAALFVVEPAYFTSIVTGQGYFIKTLIYSTVAEAQAPSFDTLVISYGVVTFFLAFVGVGLFAWETVRSRFRRWQIVFLVFAVLSLYLPFSASKFLLLGAPAFALLPAEALRRLWDLGGYAELRQGMRSLTDTRSRFAAFRRTFKVRHVLVIVLVVGLLVPNVWYGIDAGIPSNSKAAASEQVYHTLPSWMQTWPSSQASSWYFGAAGSSLDTPNLYDSAAYTWLAQQDTAVPEPQRPGFVSWWDYGFQAVDQGLHPTVADNFQNGINPSGQFLLAQNQSIAIGVLAVTLLNAEQAATGQPYLPAQLNRILAQDGLNLSFLHNALVNQSADYRTVVGNPALYLPVNPSTLTASNAMFMVASYYIAGATTPNGVAHIYNDIQQYTGWSVRYSMADSRLIPFSGTNTGIYYAPADLTGRVIDSAGNPETYFNVTVLGSDGHYYSAGKLPANVQAVQYYVNYFAPFYNSMIYKIYFGYNGTDVGLGPGIPGLLGSLQNDPVMPGWMMSHFEVAYQTAYYCPNAAQASSQSCFYATNKPTAIALQAQQGGVANLNATAYFGGGESMLVYYPGQMMSGTVELPNGAPVAGARVTVSDSWGIPHQNVLTGPNGQYSVILPPGNDTVNVTMGTLQGLTQQGNIMLASTPVAVPMAVGFSYSAPAISRTIVVGASAVQGIVYWNVNNGSAYDPTVDTPVAGATALLWGVPNATPLRTTTDAGGTFQMTNVPPGVYNYSVLFNGTNYTQTKVYIDSQSSPVNASAGLSPVNLTGSVRDAHGNPIVGALVTVASSSGVAALAISNSTGAYMIRTLGPGNYTVTASGPGSNQRSLGSNVVVTAIGARLSVNLTVFPTAPVTLTASANGVPLSGVPIRITPIPSASSPSLVDAYVAAQGNATLLTTGAAGTVTAQLPIGNYSLYATGFVRSQLYAATGRVSVATAGAPLAVTNLVLRPAAWIDGTVTTISGTNATSAVIAYDLSGSPTVVTTTNGTFALALPLGNYSLLTLQSPLTSPTVVDAALTSASLAGPLTLSITPGTSLTATFPVNTLLPDGNLYAATGANVSVSIGPHGPSVTAFSDSQGNVTFKLPQEIGTNATYCVGATLVGYLPAQECGITPSGLSELTRLPIAFAPITLSVTVSGGPPSAPVTLNVTGTSPTAGSYSLTGGPSFRVEVTPGNYSLTAFAAGTANVSQYRSGQTVTVALPLGSSASSAAFALLYEVNTSGTLRLPAGVKASAVTIQLSSPSATVAVNGTQWSRGFYAPPGAYSAHIEGSAAGVNYTNLTAVVVPANGAITPVLQLSLVGVDVGGQFLAPNGTALRVDTAVTFVAPSGATTSVPVTAGVFSTTLPTSTTYSLLANFTSTAAGPNGSYLVRYSSGVGANRCAVGTSSIQCPVHLAQTTPPVWLNGSLRANGYPTALAGQVELIGPYPSVNTTLLAVPAGTFSVALQPGSYYLYANESGSNPLANLTTVTVLSTAPPLVVNLLPSWDVRVTVQAPSPLGGSPSAQLVIGTSTGSWIRFASVGWNGTVSVALPVGVYSLAANATGSPFGIASEASARSSVALLSGNVATSLSLQYALNYAATGTATGPTHVSLPSSGGTFTFGVGLQNTGNVPVTVHLVGSPAYWNFTTSLTNVTLGVTGASRNASGEVQVIVPPGTLVQHPAIVLSVVLPNGTSIGNVQAVPTVQVATSYGLSLSSLPATDTQVGLFTILVPFSVTNRGNLVESVGVSVADSTQLSTLGWNTSIAVNGVVSAGPTDINPGASQTFTLNLTQVGPAAVPPGTAVVSVAVLNRSADVQQSLTLSIPSTSVNVRQITGVTGPSVGTAPNLLPDWLLLLLALLPAILVAVLAGVYRWNRSRRWRQW